MNLTGNKILITGGASGIGFALAERFSQEGNTIIICGRRQDALDEAQQKNPSWITRVADASTEEGRTALVEWVMKEHPDTNVLVNNAGIQNWMKIDEPDYYTRA
ncbi:MAG TPA: SDR family NAD(P)-dependent oxidoreductase, partial [Saprospiraceae bacterium]|nr:SDR family NAD(P)-dependent oxidoreductase [Saprospiraceae bacterium]